MDIIKENQKVLNEPVISELKEGMPAEVAGMLSGDEIKFINDKDVSTWDDLTSIIHSLPEEEISMVIKRGDEPIDYKLKTMSSPFPNGSKIDTIGLIGISPVILYSDISLLDAIGVGYSRTVGSFGMMIMSINMLISGSASVSDFGGPIMIAQLAGETAEAGWVPFLTFMALISVNLAFINILPIPGLDGGHIFLHSIEALIRRPLTIRTRIVIQQIGMSFLLILMLTVMFNDINRFFDYSDSYNSNSSPPYFIFIQNFIGYFLLSSANQIEIAESFLNLLRLTLLGSTQVESQLPYFELTSKLLLISTVRVSKYFF